MNKQYFEREIKGYFYSSIRSQPMFMNENATGDLRFSQLANRYMKSEKG
jgi:hypothetical protein